MTLHNFGFTGRVPKRTADNAASSADKDSNERATKEQRKSSCTSMLRDYAPLRSELGGSS